MLERIDMLFRMYFEYVNIFGVSDRTAKKLYELACDACQDAEHHDIITAEEDVFLEDAIFEVFCKML